MKRALLALALLTGATSAHAEGRNCREATQPADVAVCKSPILRGKDERTNRAFASLVKAYLPTLHGEALAELRQGHAKFLKQRSQCGSQEACLRRVYDGRLQELEWELSNSYVTRAD